MAAVTPKRLKNRDGTDFERMYYHLFRRTNLAYTHLHEAMRIIRAAQQQTEDIFIQGADPEDTK